MSDWWNQTSQPVGAETPPAEAPANCPWCAQPAVANASYCASCGAVLAQHEDLGGVVVPGVTTVDPAMQARGTTSSLIGSQSRMSTISMVGRIGGTTAQVAVAASMLAMDALSNKDAAIDPERVGNPSQAAIDMSHRLRRQPTMTESPAPADDSMTPGAGPTAQTTEPEPDEPGR
jgi:hypothetical protein